MVDVPYRVRNALVLAKTETTPGQDAAPTPAANAILVDDPRITHDLISVETNEVTGDLDVGATIPAGGRLEFRCGVLFRGSGAAATPPPVAPLLRACSMAETITATAVTGTAQSGTSNSIRLATSASSVSDTYVGMVVRITAGTGAGQSRIIYDYTGSTRDALVVPNWNTAPDNTSQYSIDANVMYRPGETEAPCSIYHYLHHVNAANSKLTKMIGAAGTFDLAASVRELPRLDFRILSKLASASDVTRPAAPSYPNLQPPPLVAASVALNSAPIAAARIGLSVGAAAQMVDDPNEEFGFDRPQIAERRTTITLAIPVQTESALNMFSSWRDGTLYRLGAMWGSQAGNRFAFVAPYVRVSSWRLVERDGLAYYEATMRPSPSAPVPFAITFW
jgi:hypothetical protein